MLLFAVILYEEPASICCFPYSPIKVKDPVVQSIVSLTISLRHKFVKQISAYFLLKKCENPLQCKVSTKNISVFVILMFEILTKR